MWLTLLSLVNPIASVTGKIIEARTRQEDAKTKQEKIRADERVKTLEARRDVLIAEAGVSNINIIMRSVFAAPLAFILWKILVYDKLLDGFTPPLGAEVWNLIYMATGFYFLYEGGMGITKVIKR